jgi:hypothetical protein
MQVVFHEDVSSIPMISQHSSLASTYATLAPRQSHSLSASYMCLLCCMIYSVALFITIHRQHGRGPFDYGYLKEHNTHWFIRFEALCDTEDRTDQLITEIQTEIDKKRKRRPGQWPKMTAERRIRMFIST